VLEVMGWDEAFLGVDTDAPEALAADVRRAVLDGTSLHCCVGIGDNLLRAKIATEFAKPPGPGVFTLTAANWEAMMDDRPTRSLWGIGAKTAAKLADRGLHTVRELAAADPAALAADLGPAMGPSFVQLGRGIGRARVEGTPWVARSRSRETTFPVDLAEWADVRAEVAALAHRVAADVAAEDRPAARVGVKVRFVPFTTRSRSVTLDAPTSDAAVIEAGALAALDKFTTRRAVRLVGVRAEF
jgi:DNA polymerase-4